MGSPYTSQSVSNYNANPPSDDGASTEANRGKWATIKTKLTDPLNTFASAVNSAISTAFGKIVGGAGITNTAISYSVVSGDQGKLVRATASGITITTPDATDVGAPFVFSVLNNSSGDITLDGSGSQTINGAASLTMTAGDGYQVYTDGSNWFVIGRKTGVLGRGYIDGCILSNGTDATNDINVAAGVCRDSTNTVDITVAAMAGKQLDANWAPGAAAGMRNSAAGITDTTYHIYAVAKADGTQDIYAHTSTTVATVITALQAESGGSAYIYARRIGSIVRASAAILGFVQRGKTVLWTTPILDVDVLNPGTSAVTRTLTVPTGIVVEALMIGAVRGVTTGSVVVYLSSLDVTDMVASSSVAPLGSLSTVASSGDTTSASQNRVFTNTSAQIRTRQSASGANDTFRISTYGYVDSRGVDA